MRNNGQHILTPIRPESRGRKASRSVSSTVHSLESPEISPTDRRRASGIQSHRKALAVLGADQTGSPSNPRLLSRGANPYRQDSSHHGSLGNRSLSTGMASQDGSENEPSPTSRLGAKFTFPSESSRSDHNARDRRSSAASDATVRSESSGSSTTNAKFRKKLQGFFGDEYHEGADFEGPSQSHHHARRVSNEKPKYREGPKFTRSRNASESRPDQSRPDTAPPSSEITPWLYQSFDVSDRCFFFFLIGC